MLSDAETKEKMERLLDDRVHESFHRQLKGISRRDLMLIPMLFTSPEMLTEVFGKEKVLKLIEKFAYIGAIAATINEHKLGDKSIMDSD